MATEELNFHYDAQIRRSLMQVVRIFGQISYATDFKSDGSYIKRRVPVRLAMTNRQVAHILKNNSENVMLSVPAITVNLNNLVYDRNRVQEPFHVNKVQIAERDYNEETGEYGNKVGGTYTLERYMAVPYTMELQVDLWASNTEQKNQIFEQIAVLFNPSLQLQTSDNVFDWTSLTELSLESVSYTSRGVPIGTSDEIEVLSMNFTAPIWFSPPAILERQKLINTIITNIVDSNERTRDLLGDAYGVDWDDGDLLARQIVTPGNHAVGFTDNVLTLLSDSNGLFGPNDQIFPWDPLIAQYGAFRPGITLIALNPTNDIEDRRYDIRGTVDFGAEPNELLWNIDPSTLPANTLDPVNAIIDPHKAYPGYGLPVPVTGTRYLLLDEIGTSVAWGVITARKNDIIEYDGTKWNTVFVAGNQEDDIQFVTNLFNNKQLKWTGMGWVFALEGIYTRGFWRILL